MAKRINSGMYATLWLDGTHDLESAKDEYISSISKLYRCRYYVLYYLIASYLSFCLWVCCLGVVLPLWLSWLSAECAHPLIILSSTQRYFCPGSPSTVCSARLLSFSGSQSLSLQCSVNLSNIPCVDSLLIFIVLSRESYWFISCLPACQPPR